jgi:hypothetical protein
LLKPPRPDRRPIGNPLAAIRPSVRPKTLPNRLDVHKSRYPVEVIDADQRPHGSWTPTRPPARLLNGALIEGVAATIMQRMPTEEAVGGRDQSRMLIARL